MADFYMLSTAMLKADTNPQATPQSTPSSTTKESTKQSIGIFSLLIGFYAAYLSWTCNTAKGVDTTEKVIYAIFAYIFGFFYLIYYLLVNKPCVGKVGQFYYF